MLSTTGFYRAGGFYDCAQREKADGEFHQPPATPG